MIQAQFLARVVFRAGWSLWLDRCSNKLVGKSVDSPRAPVEYTCEATTPLSWSRGRPLHSSDHSESDRQRELAEGEGEGG